MQRNVEWAAHEPRRFIWTHPILRLDAEDKIHEGVGRDYVDPDASEEEEVN